MSRQMSLPKFRRAQVWFDEPLPAHFDGQRRSIVCRSARAVRAAHSSVALELVVPRGGVISYALLGGTCETGGTDIPQDSATEVFVSHTSTLRPYLSEDSAAPKDLMIGIAEEYVPAILDGVSEGFTLYGRPDVRILDLRWGAHSVVGSSPDIFKRIARLLVRLMVFGPRDPQDPRELIEGLVGD